MAEPIEFSDEIHEIIMHLGGSKAQLIINCCIEHIYTIIRERSININNNNPEGILLVMADHSVRRGESVVQISAL